MISFLVIIASQLSTNAAVWNFQVKLTVYVCITSVILLVDGTSSFYGWKVSDASSSVICLCML